jgi:SAM-dependent methyltransferase
MTRIEWQGRWTSSIKERLLSDRITYLNLGCGSRYHPDWINIDIAPHSPEIIQHDISRGIPLPDESCDVVYHSAVLEHMRRADATTFITECYRVLKPGGILRVGVPDLESLCRLYLSNLDAALEGDEKAARHYDWLMLELYDQSVREKSGGGMLDYLRQTPLPDEAFIYERIGEEGRELVKALRAADLPDVTLSFPRKLRRRLRSIRDTVSHHLLGWLLGVQGRQALEIGRFRLAGEVHQWAYDRYSLALLLESVGFQDPKLKDAAASQIPDWTRFHLDTLPDGQVIKPDLLFMEAVKNKP